MSIPSDDWRSRGRRAVDLTLLADRVVLGEPAGVLASAMLKLEFGRTVGGMTEMTGVLPSDEAESLSRAMAVAAREVSPADMTRGERDVKCLFLVARRLAEAAGTSR